MHPLLLLGTVALAAATAASATAAGGSLVQDGGFEAHGPLASWLSLRAGTGSIPGWRVTSGTGALVGRYFQAYEGGNSLEIGSPGPGTIERTIATVAGARYRLTFALAGNPDGPPRVKTVYVSAGATAQTFTFDVTGRSRAAMGWVLRSLDFTATAETTPIRFARRDGGATAWWGPVIDDVQVSALADTPALMTTPAPSPRTSPAVSALGQSGPEAFAGLWQAQYPGRPLRVFVERNGNTVVAHAIDAHAAIGAGHIAWHGRIDRAPVVVLAICVDPDAKGWHGAVIEWAGPDTFHLRVADCHAGDVLYTRTR